MMRAALQVGAWLAPLAILGLPAPAMACAYSRPVFTADPVGTGGDRLTEPKVRVERQLFVRGLVAVHATVIGGSGTVRRGDSIIIIVPKDDTANCYYGGLADPETVTSDGTLEGYVLLLARREPSGAFSAELASDGDRFRYAEFGRSRMRGEWRRARFESGHD